MSAAGSKRVNVLHRKVIFFSTTRALSTRNTSGHSAGNGSLSQPLGEVGILGVGRALNGQTSTAVYAYISGPARQGTGEFSRQRADRIADACEDAFAAFIDFRSGVIERVHRQIGNHEEVGLQLRAFQRVSSTRRKSPRSNGASTTTRNLVRLSCPPSSPKMRNANFIASRG